MYLRPAITLLLSLTILLGAVYPVTVTGLAQWWFPYESKGSLIMKNDQVIGSALIGQSFTQPKYFWGRLGNNLDDLYNPEVSGGINLAATNPELIERSVQRLIELNLDKHMIVPTMLISHSGSGLDPHIDLDSALIQVDRIAKARGLSKEQLIELIMEQHTENLSTGWVSQINVLLLNLSLDKIESR